MRELGSKHDNKKLIVKIAALSFALLFVFVGVLYFLKLDKLALKGPSTVVKLITDKGLESDNNRTNVLLLGIGGKGHDGPELTDTIILASIKKDGSDVVLVSIPRDLWVPDKKAKINHVYAYGQEKDGNGLDDSQTAISQILGIPVHYVLRVDFNGFTKAVDLVEGLDIDIETSFIDPKYPISGKEDDLCNMTIETEEKDGIKRQVVKDATGSAIPLSEITEKNDPFVCRYEALNFQKGPTHMNGLTALKFVRSRHGTNGEGSDFARSARQQKVILAFREKILSQDTLTDPKTIIKLISTFGDSIHTNIADDDVPLFAKLGTKINPDNIRRIVLDASRVDSKLTFGEPQNYQGQSVVIPKDNNWIELTEYIQSEVFKLEEKQN